MYLEKINLKGQVAVVTGGGRNIGFASARALGEAGAHVVITDIDDDSSADTVANLLASDISASYHRMDVTSSCEVNDVAKILQADFGRIDILVANAGIGPCTPAEEMTDEEWQRVLDVNLTGVFYCDRAFGRLMLENPNGGKIVNIGSIAGMVAPHPQSACHYNATKAAVHMLTKSLAQEWAKRNIRVNAVAPTYIETDMIEGLITDHKDWHERWVDFTPMGRLGKPHEIASVVLFLASDLSSLMSGSVVVADAAYTCW